VPLHDIGFFMHPHFTLTTLLSLCISNSVSIYRYVALKKAMSFGEMKFSGYDRKATLDEAVVIVDTFSTGAMLADIMFHRGYRIICVLSGDLEGLLDMIPEGLSYTFSGTVVLNSSIEPHLAVDNVLAEIKALNFPVMAVFAGAETGILNPTV
jgi:hypothetical protein